MLINRIAKQFNIIPFIYRAFFALLLACNFISSAQANPDGGTVAAGEAGINQDGNKLEIIQKSEKAIIDWNGFDIAKDEVTQFTQPSSSSLTLNRVHSGSASKIDGAITANGNIIIVNQNGVWFGSTAQVDVNGLIASTSDISDDAFMKGEGGRLVFDKPGQPDASIINEGQITAKEAGLIGLVAPTVINRGVIQAQLGQVHLVSGDAATIDMYGDGLLSFAVSDDVKSQLIENSGTIQANGGTISLSAAAGGSIVNSIVNIKGELRAPAISQHAGKIIISAQGSHTSPKEKKDGSSVVNIYSTLDASGRDDTKLGGTIIITGDEIHLYDGASIYASGNPVDKKSTDNSITINAGTHFVNEAKGDVLTLEQGRWLIYSNNPEGNNLGELKSDFRRYSCTYGDSCPSIPTEGNGLLYRYTPTLTITANSIADIIYGTAKPSLTSYAYSISGYLDGDDKLDSLSGSIDGSTNYVPGSGIGIYGIDFASGGLSSTIGYGFSYASNSNAFSVTPRAITISAIAKTKTYGSVDPSLTYSVTSGALYGSDAISGTLNRAVGENAGIYAINKNTLSAGSNYTVTYTGNNLTINKAGLTVNATAQSKFFGDTDPALTYTYAGLKNSDTASVFTGALNRAVGENAGIYAINQNTLSAGGNYTISYTGNSLTINKAKVVVIDKPNDDSAIIITKKDVTPPTIIIPSTNTDKNSVVNNQPKPTIIPVTVLRVAENPTLNFFTGNNPTRPTTFLLPTDSQGNNGSENTNTNNGGSSGQNQNGNSPNIPTLNNYQANNGGWLTMSPELASQLGNAQ